jgi:magnesium transporter
MKCELGVSDLPPQFPKEDVDVYKVVSEGDRVYVRLELSGEPHYLTVSGEEVEFHSTKLVQLLRESEFQECTPRGILSELFYSIVYELGVTRAYLYSSFDRLYDEITGGQLKGTEEIREIRRKIFTLYSDTSSLYYACRKLERIVGKEVLEDVQFALERAEILAVRTSDIYNIYLTEVQNELNVIIKKLTSVSFIFLPITAVASLYAVGFPSLPQTLNSPNTAFFLLPLIVLGVGLTLYLRRVGWF